MRRVLFGFLFITLNSGISVAQANNVQDAIDAIYALCVAGGEKITISGGGEAGVDISLKKFDVAGRVKGEIKIDKTQAKGLAEGLSNAMTNVTADQADKVRECITPYRDRIMDMILTRPPAAQPSTIRPSGSTLTSVKQALRDGDAIVVDIEIPANRNFGDHQFLTNVGETVSFVIGDYDPISGRGEISQTSFGEAHGRVTATETTLSIANGTSVGCSGSFRLVEQGTLRGRISCRSGAAFPTYSATINLGP